MKMGIRIAKPEDAVSLNKIREATWLDTYPNEEYGLSLKDLKTKDFFNPDAIESWKESIRNQGDESRYWLISVDGEDVAFAIAKKGKEVNELSAIYVHPNYQKRGLGSKIMEKILDFLGTEKAIEVEVVSYNLRTRKFYEKYGFNEIIKESGYEIVPEIFIPTMIIRKKLFDI